MLDWFALFILIVLLATAVGGALLLGYLPGKIARQRSHPQAEAVSVCGWIGLLSGGLLLPIAYVWAYWQFPQTLKREASA
ncbi:MAG: DUF3302 domain-containing protein [Rhodopirellula sp. JB055]|uniref:DUF3302 domain-containing protein n=1 Tax=Rhodopirellula sp. JB055 TaxID=3342846 RepID=UPI00370A2577